MLSDSDMRWRRVKIKRLMIVACALLPLLIVLKLFHVYQYRSTWSKPQVSPPGSFLRHVPPANTSYCSFGYGLPEYLEYDEADVQYSPELGIEGGYRVLYNVIEGKERANSSVPVTFATHVTTDFLEYVAEVLKRWEGPVSIAAYVPGEDAHVVTLKLFRLCWCLPEMSRVTVHYVFDKNEPAVVHSSTNSSSQLSSCMMHELNNVFPSYRVRKDLIYPVNVCRNVARNAAFTYFVLVADVQLMPSDNLASKFMDMAHKMDIKTYKKSSKVYVLPLFEIEAGEVIPRTKTELLRLMKKERAMYFHRMVCTHCQKFPGLQRWLQVHDDGTVEPFMTVAREYPYHRWEPIYVGTKHEPYYNELLSWEGRQDKMAQMLEMCLMRYRFVILNGAFMVHWPGIKRISPKPSEINIAQQRRNSIQYDLISNYLFYRYPENAKCYRK